MSDPPTAGALLSGLYEELRRLAASKLAAEPPGATLSPTVLVHEAWLRLGRGGGGDGNRWRNRGHYMRRRGEESRFSF